MTQFISLNLYCFRYSYLRFPSFHILSILANCFASKFSDLLTFINFMFPTFTQFEKRTVKKSNFDSFHKVIFYSLPDVGQLHIDKYVFGLNMEY